MSGNIQLKNKEGTSAYYFAMQVRNSVQPIDKLEVSTNGGASWTSVPRLEYNYFTAYGCVLLPIARTVRERERALTAGNQRFRRRGGRARDGEQRRADCPEGREGVQWERRAGLGAVQRVSGRGRCAVPAGVMRA